MFHRPVVLALAAAIGLLVFPAHAQDKEGDDAEKWEWKKRAEDEAKEEEMWAWKKKAAWAKQAEQLGRTVKVDFDLIPEEDNTKPLSVLCATRKYSMSAEVKGQDGGFQWSIDGELTPTKDSRRLLLTYNARLAYESPQWKSEVKASGSSEVTIGKKATIAELGDKKLVVLISADPNRKKKDGDKKGKKADKGKNKDVDAKDALGDPAF